MLLWFFPTYRLTLSALGIKLNEYWRMVTEKQAKKRAFNAVDGQQGEEESLIDEWVSDKCHSAHIQRARLLKKDAKIWIKMLVYTYLLHFKTVTWNYGGGERPNTPTRKGAFMHRCHALSTDVVLLTLSCGNRMAVVSPQSLTTNKGKEILYIIILCIIDIEVL